MERYIWTSSQIGIQIEEILDTTTGNGIFWIRAGKGKLVENGLVAAQERPLEHLRCTVRVDNSVANVEDLTVVVFVSVITVITANE